MVAGLHGVFWQFICVEINYNAIATLLIIKTE